MVSTVKNQPKNQYLPDYVSPPGETLLELLEDRGMSQADLADQVYQRGRYDLAIDYSQPTQPRLNSEDEIWASSLLTSR